jgi:FkbM family methyltransferase
MSCCSDEYREKTRYDFLDRIRKILTKPDMPYIVSWFIPDHFVKFPESLWDFVTGDQSDLVERLATYLILLENKKDVIDAEIRTLFDALRDLNWDYTVTRNDVPVFFLLSRLVKELNINRGTPFSGTEPVLSKDRFFDTVKPENRLTDFPVRSLVDLDASRLPDVVRHVCDCAPFNRSRCSCTVHVPSASNRGYLAALSRSRDLAAELNRVQGPFILTSGMTSIVDAWASATQENSEIVFVEVGAHLGDAALFACELFSRTPQKTAKIIAFEPNPDVFKYFQESIILNGYEHLIDARNKALSYEPGEGSFAPFLTSSVHSTLAGRSPFASEDLQATVTKVPLSTLDLELASLHARIDLLMIHTNGAELDVLYGAKETLKKTNAVKIRFYGNARFTFGNKTYLGEEKRADILRVLSDSGCREVEWPEGGNKDEEPLLAQCR